MGSLIYRCRLVAMLRTLNSPLRSRALPWRAAVCVLLAALFLYNPFLTIDGASQILNVQHPLSCRTTVASGELWRCTVEPAQSLLPALEVAAAFKLLRTSTDKEVLPAPPRDLLPGVPQTFGNSLWFRPPPVL